MDLYVYNTVDGGELDTGHLSIQDMIESDMQCDYRDSDIDAFLSNADKLSMGIDYCCQGMPINNNNTKSIDVSAVLEDLTHNSQWLGNTLSEVTPGVISQSNRIEMENADPNLLLLVNPQTGMPVHLNEVSSTMTNANTNHAHTHTPPLQTQSPFNMDLQQQIPAATPPNMNSAQHYQLPQQNLMQYVRIGLGNANNNVIKVHKGHHVSSMHNPSKQQQQQQPAQIVLTQNTIGLDPSDMSHIQHSNEQQSFCPSSHPARNNPLLLERLQNSTYRPANTLQFPNNNNVNMNNNNLTYASLKIDSGLKYKVYPKPAYSYSCLIAMALNNSETGSLPVSEIYNFMIDNFPYFKTAPGGWKNSVRHNLSLNKCFEKVDNPCVTGHAKKGCLWALNPAKVDKMQDEILKWRNKDPEAVRNSMSHPESLELIEQGRAGAMASPKRYVPSTPTKSTTVLTCLATPTKLIEISAANTPKTENPYEVTSTTPSKPILPNIYSADFSLVDSNSLQLDPVLSEIAAQSGLWDDDVASELNMDPSLPQSSLISSPLTNVQSNVVVTDSLSPEFTIKDGYIYSTSKSVHLIESPSTKSHMFYTHTPTLTVSAN